MTHLWSLLLLVPPLIATVAGARSAWLWLWLAVGFVAIWAMLFYVSWDWANGGTGGIFAPIFAPPPIDRRYHDTYYVVAHFRYLGGFLIPSLLIAALLFIPHHPRRAVADIVLFWAAVALFVTINVAPQLYFANGGMPGRYIDYTETFQVINTVTNALAGVFLAVLAVAALRPVNSWWRNRKSSHAL